MIFRLSKLSGVSSQLVESHQRLVAVGVQQLSEGIVHHGVQLEVHVDNSQLSLLEGVEGLLGLCPLGRDQFSEEDLLALLHFSCLLGNAMSQPS